MLIQDSKKTLLRKIIAEYGLEVHDQDARARGIANYLHDLHAIAVGNGAQLPEGSLLKKVFVRNDIEKELRDAPDAERGGGIWAGMEQQTLGEYGQPELNQNGVPEKEKATFPAVMAAGVEMVGLILIRAFYGRRDRNGRVLQPLNQDAVQHVIETFNQDRPQGVDTLAPDTAFFSEDAMQSLKRQCREQLPKIPGPKPSRRDVVQRVFDTHPAHKVDVALAVFAGLISGVLISIPVISNCVVKEKEGYRGDESKIEERNDKCTMVYGTVLMVMGAVVAGVGYHLRQCHIAEKQIRRDTAYFDDKQFKWLRLPLERLPFFSADNLQRERAAQVAGAEAPGEGRDAIHQAEVVPLAGDGDRAVAIGRSYSASDLAGVGSGGAVAIGENLKRSRSLGDLTESLPGGLPRSDATSDLHRPRSGSAPVR